MTTTLDKTLRIGVQAGIGSTFCRIKFADGKLSITGVEGPTRGGDCKGSCGQIIMSAWHFASYAPGWDADRVARFREIWHAWHLNDMQAGSPAQEAYLTAHPISDRANHYMRACAALAAAGLNPDPNYLHNGKAYRYGTAWLRKEVPTDVIEWLAALPETDRQPAWV